MAYIETIKRGKKNFYYLSQTVRLKEKFRKVRWFLGKGQLSTDKLKKLSKIAQVKLKKKVKEIKDIKEIISFDEVTAKRLNKIRKEYKKALTGLSKIEYDVIEKQHLVKFTFNTNAIEGSTITLKETNHILEDHITPEGKELREVHEIENTKKAYDFMKKWKKRVTLDFIRKIHYQLTFNILEENAGKYRNIQVYMQGSKHIPTQTKDVNNEMNSMIRWLRNHDKLHPIILTAYIHHLFIAIHPFIDGNGRTGRLLLNYMLMTSGYPPICIRLQERIKYTDYLELARDGDITKLLDFIVDKTEESYKEIVDNTK